MREVTGDLWTYHKEIGPTFTVITTNGYVKTNGDAVMGRGVALQAVRRYPSLPQILGQYIIESGNIVRVLPYNIISLPVKHNWWEKADLNLISGGIADLIALVAEIKAKTVYLPRPGCGNGQLKWWEDVKPLLAKLDNRFIVVNKAL